MSEETKQSMDNQLAISTGSGMREGIHDERTIHQQNNSQSNEIIQSVIEARRQEVAQFEQRMTQSNQQFQSTMQMLLQNQDAERARQAALAGQQQSYTHQEAIQQSANNLSMHYVDQGILTPWLP